MDSGTYPSQYILKLIQSGSIENAVPTHVQPSSLDLTLSDEIYKMKGIFLPQKEEKVRNLLKTGSLYRTEIEKPLECGGLYLIRLNEALRLPKNISAHTNNKSSSGRINLQARLIIDGVAQFDTVPAGYLGELWLLVSPQSFPVRLHAGDSINQIRFFLGNSLFSSREYNELFDKEQILFDENNTPLKPKRNGENSSGITMSVELKNYDIVGYKCSPSHVNILDFSKYNHDPLDFFEPIVRPKNGHIVLKKNEFYILSTKEAIRVPNHCAAEMMAYDPSNGEFRSHYAGFFDPGWGCGAENHSVGAPIVLEVMSNDADFILRHGQPICKVLYERLIEPAESIYGSHSAGSHYANQKGPRLSKHFSVM